MRGILALILLLPLAAACIGPGYSCDKGAVEIHMPVNVKAAEKVLVEANVTLVGQMWGTDENIHVFYGQKYPILFYIWPKGVRIQVAVKDFERNGTSERCVFYVDPKELNVKNIVRTELTFLREKRVVNLTAKDIGKIVKLAGWELAGNMWIEAGDGSARIEGIRGCREWPVFVLEGWGKEEPHNVSSRTILATAALLLLLWFAVRRR